MIELDIDAPAPERSRDDPQLRVDYEANVIPVRTLCALYRITYRALYDRAHLEGWKLRSPRRVDRNDLIERMLRLIQQQTDDLEIAMIDHPSGNEAAVLNKLATTLDNLISLQAGEKRPKQQRTTKAMKEIRTKVAGRLKELAGK